MNGVIIKEFLESLGLSKKQIRELYIPFYETMGIVWITLHHLSRIANMTKLSIGELAEKVEELSLDGQNDYLKPEVIGLYVRKIFEVRQDISTSTLDEIHQILTVFAGGKKVNKITLYNVLCGCGYLYASKDGIYFSLKIRESYSYLIK